MIDEMPEFLPMIVVLFIILTFVAALGLFMAMLFKRRPRNDLPLFALNARQDLSRNEADYFQYIRYDAEKGAIVLKQSQAFKKCVVTLITRKGNSRKQVMYNLEYNEGDLFCGIKLDDQVDEFRVVLESVDGVTKKHAPIDNHLTMNVVYALVVSILFIISGILLITMDSYYIEVDVEGFGVLYALVALVVIYIVVIVGGFLVGEMLSKKGKFQYERVKIPQGPSY